MSRSLFESANRFSVNHMAIDNSTYNVESNGIGAFDKLCEFAANGASHDSVERFPPPKCFPGTQEAILSSISSWFTENKDKKPMLWLHGSTGMGKTAVAQTIAERFDGRGELAASFFFSRSSSERSESSKLVASLASQLAIKIPGLKRPVEEAIHNHPTILTKAPPVQLGTLIIEPCRRLESLVSRKWLIVVDGLDECIGTAGSDREQEQELVLNLLISLLSNSLPFYILLCSRAEEWLKSAFISEPLPTIAEKLALYMTSSGNSDIQHYLEGEFKRIYNDPRYKAAFRAVPKPWPPPSVFWLILKKASGQYVYAKTLIRFIEYRWSLPNIQLKKLLSAIRQSDADPTVFSALDVLYLEILAACPNTNQMLQVLGEVMCLDYSGVRSISRWDILDGLFRREPGESYQALRGLHSLVDVDRLGTTTQPLFHASFHDFLTSKIRAGKYFIDIPSVHAQILLKCLDNLCLPDNGSNTVYLYSRYAWRFHHLPEARLNEPLLARLSVFDFNDWFIQEISHEANVSWFPLLSCWVWDHGLFRYNQIQELEAGPLRVMANQCASQFRTSYDGAMVWFLDKYHDSRRLERLFNSCFSLQVGNVTVDARPGPDGIYRPALALEGDAFDDLLEQGLVYFWNRNAALFIKSPLSLINVLRDFWKDPNVQGRQTLFSLRTLEFGAHLHVFPSPFLAFLSDPSRSKHHCYITRERIEWVVITMLMDPAGFPRLASSDLEEWNQAKNQGYQFAQWFHVLCLFLELCQPSQAVRIHLEWQGPKVIEVMERLGYSRMKNRFVKAWAKHSPKS